MQVLVCGDIRGNLVLFPLLKSVLLGTLVSSDVKISPSSCSKGAHGISSISSVAVARLSSNQIEICSVRQNSLLIEHMVSSISLCTSVFVCMMRNSGASYLSLVFQKIIIKAH